MKTLQNLLEIHSHEGIGYVRLFHCRGFRVAMLNHYPGLGIADISNFQKHSQTDEAFILLKGSCTLFLAEDETLQNIHAVPLESGKVFNVKQGTYHAHILSEDASVLIVEAEDTCEENSPYVLIDEAARARLIKAYETSQ